MGIEEVAQKCPECLFKVPISVKNGPSNEQLVKLAKDLGLEGDLVQDCVDNVKALYQVFDKSDEKVICCLDAKIGFDKDAAFRQKEIFALRDKVRCDSER